MKLHNWCFWSNSTLLSFCAPYRCKHKCLRGICFYSNMEHRHGRQARRSFCSPYRCKTNYLLKSRLMWVFISFLWPSGSWMWLDSCRKMSLSLLVIAAQFVEQLLSQIFLAIKAYISRHLNKCSQLGTSGPPLRFEQHYLQPI